MGMQKKANAYRLEDMKGILKQGKFDKLKVPTGFVGTKTSLNCCSLRMAQLPLVYTGEMDTNAWVKLINCYIWLTKISAQPIELCGDTSPTRLLCGSG